MTAASATRHSSAYHHQWAQGFSSLRFQKRIESEYRFKSLAACLPQVRIALILATIAVAALLLIDLLFSTTPLNHSSLPLRVGVIESIVLALLAMSFVDRLRPYLPYACMLAGVAVGLTTVALQALGAGDGGPPLFPGCFIATVYVYFLLGSRWLPAVITGATILMSFGLLGLLGRVEAAPFVNAFVLLFATNAVGAWGLYDLEYNRRKNFLKSKMLSYLVERDPLTGISNRKAVDRLLDDAWLLCRGEDKTIAVALVDVDHFKAYNDTYGHQAGDRCLDQIATALQCASRRPLDAVGRYGGEEFLIVLPEASEYYALVLLDSIREQVQELKIDHGASPLGNVTVSIGVAFCRPYSARFDCKEFVNLADQALYKAKNQGRNRVVLGVRDGTGGATEQNYGDKVSIAFTSPV